jgi:tetratricopeptide (TPR) repeat protein
MMKLLFVYVRRFVLSIGFIAAVAVISGCSGSEQSAHTGAQSKPSSQSRETPAFKKPELSADQKQDAALQRFLEGSTFDQKGEYAKAIIEYQDALRFKEDPAIYHAIAKDYVLLNKDDLAVSAGEKAVAIDPTNRQYRETLAQIYVNILDIDKSVGQFREIVKQDPSYKSGWLNLARLIEVHNADSALIIYQNVIDRFGPDITTLSQIAQIYDAKGQQDKAAEALKEMIALDPDNYELKKGLGDTYLRQDSVDAALKVYDEIILIRPDDIELRASLAHAYLVKQDYKRAAEQFEKVMSKDSIALEDQIRFGQIFVSFVEKDSAVMPYAKTLFTRIRDANSADWRPYWFLGALDNIIHDDSSALKNFSKVKELAPWNPDGWVGVASIYYDSEHFKEAIDILNEAKAKVPDEFRIHFLLGISYQRSKQPSEAEVALERAVELNGKSVDAVTALALVYDELSRKADSDSMYEKALRLDPQNHLALNNYAYSLAERGLQLQRALLMAKEAIKQQPTNQSYLDTYGWIFYQLGNYREAEAQIRKAVELGSTSAVILEHLGDIYFKLSDKEKAMTYWRKALDAGSTSSTLKEKIERGSL